MPKLDIDMFDEAPKVGDKVKVTGKVKHINEDSGTVEVSYDDVSIVKKHHKKSHDNNDNEDNTFYTRDQNVPQEMQPNSQSLDEALNQSFGTTQ